LTAKQWIRKELIVKEVIVKEVMLATTNPGKIKEMRALLAPWTRKCGVALLTPQDWPQALPEVAETGKTFAENARLKAAAVARATGMAALADDSGLCVEALGGAPGLHSARWAGGDASDAARNALLLSRLSGVPEAWRGAEYVCAVCLALPDGGKAEAAGVCTGRILEQPRGANGFGYDPLFLLPALGRTMAELTAAEKNAQSHRARALAALVECLLVQFPTSV